MKILLVNDLELVNKFLKRSLEAEGFSVETVLTGREGIARARENRYDIILLDYKLPDIDGGEVCKAIRADAQTGRVPIYYISSLAKDKLEEVIRETAANGYLDTGVAVEELAANIRSAAGKS